MGKKSKKDSFLSKKDVEEFRETYEHGYTDAWPFEDDPYKDKNRYTTGMPVEGSGSYTTPSDPYPIEQDVNWKYCEDEIINDFRNYLRKTYTEHYKSNDDIECFDAWIALGESGPTFRNTALKYLWRYGNKDGVNKKDLLKAMHYVLMLMYVDHYREVE